MLHQLHIKMKVLINTHHFIGHSFSISEVQGTDVGSNTREKVLDDSTQHVHLPLHCLLLNTPITAPREGKQDNRRKHCTIQCHVKTKQLHVLQKAMM